MFTLKDENFMKEALKEAKLCLKTKDVPVGAIVVLNDEIIGRGHNCREKDLDITGHAELMALKEASQTAGTWQLKGARVYVTLEPCPMCASALVQARVSSIIYGCDDEKLGACGSLLNLPQFPGFDSDILIRSGLLKETCSALLKDFFRQLR